MFCYIIMYFQLIEIYSLIKCNLFSEIWLGSRDQRTHNLCLGRWSRRNWLPQSWGRSWTVYYRGAAPGGWGDAICCEIGKMYLKLMYFYVLFTIFNTFRNDFTRQLHTCLLGESILAPWGHIICNVARQMPSL